MAQPIGLVRKRMSPLSEHPDPGMAIYEFLEELQDHGVLDLLRGLTVTGSEVITMLAKAANTPEVISTMRNAIVLLKLFSSAGRTWRQVGAVAYGLRVFGRKLLS